MCESIRIRINLPGPDTCWVLHENFRESSTLVQKDLKFLSSEGFLKLILIIILDPHSAYSNTIN